MSDVPMPKASPRHPRAADGDTQPGIASTEYVKRKLRNANLLTRVVGAAVAAAVTAGLGFFFSARHDESDAKATAQVQEVDHAGLERLVRLEQKLSDHIDAENQRWVGADAREQKSVQVQAAMNAKLDLELDQHGVPRARRPQPEDFAPAGPPGEQK